MLKGIPLKGIKYRMGSENPTAVAMVCYCVESLMSSSLHTATLEADDFWVPKSLFDTNLYCASNLVSIQ